MTPVADVDRDAHRASFRDHGATGRMEAWGNGVPPDGQADFARAVVPGWVIWPDKAIARRCFAAIGR